jgi:hypothetical protein
MADEIDFLTVSNPAPSPITEEELATFLAVGKSWQVQEDEIEKEAERVYELTELAILDRQRNDLHQKEAERDAREADRDQREAKRDKREAERDASPDDFHDGWMKRADRSQARNARETLRNTREAERGKREAERKRCKALADARRQAEMDRREAERDQREAERDRLAREADQQAYKANRKNRVTLLQIVKKQREAFEDRGADGEDFPDAYVNYLSGLSGGASLLLHEHEKDLQECREHFPHFGSPSPEEKKKHKLLLQKVNTEGSFDKKILEKARELYATYEPERYKINKWRNGTFFGNWEALALKGLKTRDEYIAENWFKEKQRNSNLFKEYVNMAKKKFEQEYQVKLEKKRLEEQEYQIKLEKKRLEEQEYQVKLKKMLEEQECLDKDQLDQEEDLFVEKDE